MSINIAFAGDRKISVDILKFIIEEGVLPEALFVSSRDKASHDKDLIDICDHLDDSKIFRGDEFKREENVSSLKKSDLDYIISIHYPYMYPKEVLDIPKHGIINLHPAYLPFNRGWHTPTWAIYEETPYGATLHFLDEKLDSGDIISRKWLDIRPDDTADTLYKRNLEIEKELFKESWEDLVNFDYSREENDLEKGTIHTRYEIEKIQEIDLKEKVEVEKLVRRLRALTTNKISEAAYFLKDGGKYRVQINIELEEI
ncbi:MAG: formyltransferase family protein [Thermoplasmatota archaeon]